MVKYLNYKGEKLPIRVSYYVLKKIKEKLGVKITSIDTDDYQVQEAILFYGLEKGFKLEGKEFPFKMEDMEDVMDEVFFEFMKMIPEFFGVEESQDPTNPTAKETEEVVKKK